jgi:hypothetical protein
MSDELGPDQICSNRVEGGGQQFTSHETNPHPESEPPCSFVVFSLDAHLMEVGTPYGVQLLVACVCVPPGFGPDSRIYVMSPLVSVSLDLHAVLPIPRRLG